MRWFSRLGAWLRAGAAQGPDDGPRTLPLLAAEQLPTVPSEVFQRRLLRAVGVAIESEKAEVSVLDPTVQLLVIPPSYRSTETAEDPRLGRDIDAALEALDASGRQLASLTWSALRDAQPEFEPSYHTWAGENADWFAGSVGLVFFLDVDAITLAMAQAAQKFGFYTRLLATRPAVVVHDGRFSAHVGINALLAESLWTGRGPLSVIRRRARALPAEFRGFLAALSGLERRFETAAIGVEGEHLGVRTHALTGRIDYRRLAASVRASGLSVDDYLARCRLVDLLDKGGTSSVMLRSPGFARAWPDAVHRVGEGHVVVAVRQDDEGRARPVLVEGGDEPPDRLSHFIDEAHRQVGLETFSAHAAVMRPRRDAGGQVVVDGVAHGPDEGDDRMVVALVGDRVAGIALDARLCRGAIEQLMPMPDEVCVRVLSEDALLLFGDRAEPDAVEACANATHDLERDLVADPSERLAYEARYPLPAVAGGSFELTVIDEAYFGLRREGQAQRKTDPGRAHFLDGLAMQAIGQLEKARDALTKAVTALRDDGDLNLALGQLHIALESQAEGLPFLERAAKLMPHNAEAANALGLARWDAGSASEATAAFERAVRLEPTETAFLINLGRSYVDVHLYSKARACLEKALNLAPSSAEAHASMALLCHKTGDARGARRHAREALAEEPDDENVQTLLREIEVEETLGQLSSSTPFEDDDG